MVLRVEDLGAFAKVPFRITFQGSSTGCVRVPLRASQLVFFSLSSMSALRVPSGFPRVPTMVFGRVLSALLWGFVRVPIRDLGLGVCVGPGLKGGTHHSELQCLGRQIPW